MVRVGDIYRLCFGSRRFTNLLLVTWLNYMSLNGVSSLCGIVIRGIISRGNTFVMVLIIDWDLTIKLDGFLVNESRIRFSRILASPDCHGCMITNKKGFAMSEFGLTE